MQSKFLNRGQNVYIEYTNQNNGRVYTELYCIALDESRAEEIVFSLNKTVFDNYMKNTNEKES